MWKYFVSKFKLLKTVVLTKSKELLDKEPHYTALKT